MTLNRLIIFVAVLVLVVSIGVVGLWQYACTPERADQPVVHVAADSRFSLRIPGRRTTSMAVCSCFSRENP
jgi:hypothetical protein